MRQKVFIGFMAVLALSLASPLFAQQTGPQPFSPLSGDRYRAANEWLSRNNLSLTASPSEPFIRDYVMVTGEGLASRTAQTSGEKRLTAERAAMVVAYRALAEILNGVSINGDSLVRNASEHYDVIRTAVAGFVKGAQVVYREYNETEQVALVIMKVGMNGPAGFASLLYEKLLNDPALREGAIEEKTAYIPPVPAFVELVHDGLIIDAEAQTLKPALINRILNQKGEMIYDPSKIGQKVLVENGCGEYTNSVEKARAVLASRGVKNPLLIKATGTASSTDATVSEEDAVKIFAANQKTNFFAEAKVAFVLK